MRSLLRAALLIACLVASGHGVAHAGSNSFIYWTPGADSGRVDLAVADVAPWLDAQRPLTWGQVEKAAQPLQQRVAAGLNATDATGEPCPLTVTLAGLTRYGSDAYVSFAVQTGCTAPATLGYGLLFDQDPLHRALVTLGSDEPVYQVLSPGQGTLALTPDASGPGTFLRFGWQGMVHLWLGYDHLLFLLTLMLAVLASGRRTEHRAHRYIIDTVAVVTAFTVAHSITLVLAATGTVRLPISLVEVVIALSITFAAIQVRWPLVRVHPWLLAFAFGLVHGFGFASVLADLVPEQTLPWLPLASFNLGLELAQIVVVVLAMPLLFFFMRYSVWHRVGQPLAVLAVAATGLWWAFSRMPVSL
ncbi:MAG: HupE/UreJ family protein [Alcanivoracaceae bacterium]|nr:HupE/UreJ family protein [Alcanivoracaceae bacterium]